MNPKVSNKGSSKAEPTNDSNIYGVRDDLSLVHQVEQQIYIYRLVSNEGEIEDKGRTLACLCDLVWSLFNKSEKTEYNGLTYKRIEPDDCYNDQDKARVLRFGSTTVNRMREINMYCNSKNIIKRNERYDKMFRLILAVCQRCGMTFKTRDQGEILGSRSGYHVNFDAIKSTIKKKPHGSVILNTIKKSIYEDKRNFLGLFLGKVGTGKSFSAIKLCQLMDPTFDLSRICFDEISLSKMVYSGLPPGSWILADEIASYFGSRTSMTIPNLAISRMLQTFRILRYGVCFTCPSARQVDVNLRCMFDMTLTIKRVIKKQRLVWGSPLSWSFDSISGKGYPSYPRKPQDNKAPSYVMDVYFAHPDDGPEGSIGFAARYKTKKLKSLKAMGEDDIERLVAYRNKEKGNVGKVLNINNNAKCSKCGYTWHFSGKTNPRCRRCRSAVVVVL